MVLLYVEDIQKVRDNYRELLSLYFNKIYETGISNRAYELFQAYNPDVILVDINIVGANGIELIRKIRELNKDTKIIILSAHKDEEYLFSAIELSIHKYLVKPVRRDSFKDVIHSVVTEIKQNNVIKLTTNYYWDIKSKKLFFNEKEVALSKKELSLFEEYCTKTNPIFSFENAFYSMYNDLDDYSLNKLKMIIKRLRAKTHTDIIINVYGYGYKFNTTN